MNCFMKMRRKCCNCNCPTMKTCLAVAEVTIAIETAIMAILNLLIILCCTCAIKPAEYRISDFMEKLWSWFLLDVDKCESKYEDFVIPVWYVPVPKYIENDFIYDYVKQSSNFIYQILFFILNSLWMITSILLVCGKLKNNFTVFIIWFILGVFNFILDTIVATFFLVVYFSYIMGWIGFNLPRKWVVFFWAAFYLRWFLFYLINAFVLILASVHICETLTRKWRSRRSSTHRRQQQIVIAMENMAASTQHPNEDPPSYDDPFDDPYKSPYDGPYNDHSKGPQSQGYDNPCTDIKEVGDTTSKKNLSQGNGNLFTDINKDVEDFRCKEKLSQGHDNPCTDVKTQDFT